MYPLRSTLASPLAIAIVGIGNNVNMRVAPALREADGKLLVTGFDIRAPREHVPFPVEKVPDDPLVLAHRLEAGRFDVVMVEAPGVKHPVLIRSAIQAGCSLVLCEKPLAPTIAEGEKLVALCKEVEPRQTVRLIDHYMSLGLVQQLLDIARAGRLGPPSSLRLSAFLHEAKGIGRSEVEEHAAGSGAFLHHLVALACELFNPAHLVPVEAQVALHPAAPEEVADTFRSTNLACVKTGHVLARLSVGKYFHAGQRQILLEGRDGRALLDRATNEIRLHLRDGTEEVIRGAAGDLGYRAIVQALAEGRVAGELLAPEAALQVLRLVEAAHDIALPAPMIYRSPVTDLVCDWEIRSAPPAVYSGEA